ncbi:MAG: hypothetical protein Q8S11_03295 [Daejeonella sp.]|uniref:hypothetical protein n=1 Tax=Daejeonella sp. TaxID=2805397 RepID=UPI002736D4C3|nr:hypothetical protein [Daejeonella sp.]MDP3467333.1 hypothetical protein [Daejeonella sp.]
MQKSVETVKQHFFKILGMLLLVACFSDAFSQDFNQDSITNRFGQYSGKNLQEKIYVHTDRELYLAGEILWFKLYNVNTASNTSIDFSKVAYVEIIDKNLKPVLQAKIAIDKGSGSGSLYLPVSLSSGNYQLRAYTNWMKNFSPDYYFEKNITLVNTLTKPEKKPALNEVDHDIQFFPEGGNMVESLPAKLAFRAIDSQGKGIDFRGTLVDENNNILLNFKPLKFGIGSFVFTPENGKTYRAVIEIPGSKTIIKELPSAKTGYVLQLENTSAEQIKVKIHANEGSSNQQLILFVHTRQDKKISESVTLNGGKAEFLIDRDKLSEGISHLTLFNNSGRALAERLYFTRPASQLNLGVKADKSTYATRNKVSLELLSKDEKGLDIDADASVSVFASSAGISNEADIFDYLWLKSDLKGNVESPGYYLKNKDAVADEALDNLMLTHGWRRFVWENVISKNISVFGFIPEIDGHIIEGKIIDTRTQGPANNILAYLSLPGKKLHLYGARSNSSGLVNFYTRDIYGPSELVAQTDTQQDSTYKIEILSPFSKEYSSTKPSGFILDEDLRNQLSTQSLSSQVQNVYSSTKLRTFYPALVDSSAFYLKPDKTYLLDNFVRFTTMEEVLREYVVEVPVTRQKDNFSVWVTVRPHLTDIPKSVKPLIILDGVPIFDAGNKIIKYDPKKVRSLDVVAQKYFLGPMSFEGILNFTTYKGDLPDFQFDTRATITDYEGLQLKREFYSPVYDSAIQTESRLPDFRNVLYWSPDIKINSDGKKTISFYTSDQENNYTIMFQGISSSGKAGSASLTIQVKK